MFTVPNTAKQPHTKPITMNSTETKGNWNIVKGKLKQTWADITDDDLMDLEGKTDEAIGRIQKRTGESREAIQQIIDDSYDADVSR